MILNKYFPQRLRMIRYDYAIYFFVKYLSHLKYHVSQ